MSKPQSQKNKMDTDSYRNGSDLFVYEQFPNEDYIRVIELLPGSQTDSIQCKLTVEPFEGSDNTYHAISYVWGDSKNRVQVMCNNQYLSIAISLADALRRIRSSTVSIRLWADAIEDDIERGHQVKRMGEVYENALSVLVWLGHDSEAIAEDCFNLIREFIQYTDREFNQYTDRLFELPDEWGIRMPKSSDSIFRGKSRWAKVGKLLQLPWFSRLWVIQEAGLAKSCMLLWGEQEIDIAQLVEASIWLTGWSGGIDTIAAAEFANLASTFLNVHCSYKNVNTWRSRLPANGQLEAKSMGDTAIRFVHVLAAGRGSSASDQRDHVYAFLGSPLARRTDGKLIVVPDYSKIMEEVYFELACALLDYPREQPFVLSYVGHESKEVLERRATPFWVPQWHDVPGTKISILSPDGAWYKAGGLDAQFQFQLHHNAKLLEVAGFIYDDLAWISEPIRSSNLSLDTSNWDDGVRVSPEPFIDILRKDILGAMGCGTDCSDAQERTFSLTIVAGYGTYQNLIDSHNDNYAAYLKAVRRSAALNSGHGDSSIDITKSDANGDPYVIQLKLGQLSGRRIAWTKSGRLCVIPPCARLNDVCCVFPGLQVPFILHPLENGQFLFLGNSYIHDIMNGKLMDDLKDGKFKMQSIMLA